MQRFFAILLFLILLPVILLTALIVALTSGLPVIFTQERIGMNRQPFTIYKFRTMRNGKIDVIAKVLRKTGLDELPQLINIAEGKMAFVGPRPLTQEDIVRLEWNEARHNERWSTLPGITGQAQLIVICDKEVTYKNDIDYIQNQSIGRDLRILWRSALIPILGKTRVQNKLQKS